MAILILTGVQCRILKIFEEKKGEWFSVHEILDILISEWELEEPPRWLPRPLFKWLTKPSHSMVLGSLLGLWKKKMVSERERVPYDRKKPFRVDYFLYWFENCFGACYSPV